MVLGRKPRPHGLSQVPQLDSGRLGSTDPPPQPAVPWSWPFRGVTGRAHCSAFPGGNSLSRTLLLPIPCGQFCWCPGEPDQWKLFSQRQGHPCYNGSQEVRGHRAVGWQREVVMRMEPGSGAGFLLFFLVYLSLCLVPSQTTPAFVPSLWANCKAVSSVSWER